ncbi:MAG: hypothetical protein A3C85_02690 [Candidatus Doudnabacteria bacterium RIFCSPHIGHO2_02_FULL_48_21]|uniref:AI-2E family transporter n=1 Tax=Candidatus Doudnabacteria bacterium RIFCSPLOWO2_02_FULL_48_13 TaxID=1817845 RepID=A0A1F5Q9G9_9BACT|nr:MAG: hypothetical protein A3K05_03555 [Candidatus Doudnabacteria bacterium RIFCSPHIGHO2_01_48_18]OGE79486.1 MAG: hypothetical protein A2668_00075 [Candidatus Doudnabacteria bacterium RIFCSPHIGHO2_01_FULL_48_180]OGE91319.1 MAG: hypothetical protein A3F44_03350 [Candidatus Doudnabacteria bacterium RIFCSPHIGHO2_12_FULL_47_25]OGE92864.1 MAG: hypothetical protein A3C85_02690 [Candidatus Doudnabacteria bacterium RIFCSPHIGHO2_02_FULL_48_21]OGE96650.1 MAG: hypothetical protein A3A83_01625 [Candidatu
MNEPQNVNIHISTTALIKVAIVALVLVLMYIIRDIILMLVVAMILASAMDPLVDWLYRKARFPRGMSVIMVYLFFLGLLGLVVYFLIPPMVEEFNMLSSRIEDFRHDLSTRASTLSQALNQLGLARGLSALGQSFSQLTEDVFQKTLGVVNSFVQLVGILVFTFYLISSENGMKNFIRSLVPFKHQAYIMGLTDKVQKKIGYWLLGQLVLSGFIFAFTFLGLTALGVKYALALALLAGLLEIVPYLGPILSGIPAVFVAFAQSPTLAVFVIILYILIQQTENYILVPKVMGKTVGANPLVILLAVLIGFKVAGIIGLLMAVPIVGAVSVFVSDFREQRL